jgi:hypothetical protein
MTVSVALWTGVVAIAAVACAACSGDGLTNRPPVAQADSVRARPLVPTDVDVLANDTDPDGDGLGVELTQVPAGIDASVVAGGLVRVTSTPGHTGSFLLHYRARDEHGALSSETTIDVDVGPLARSLLLGMDTNFHSIWLVADTVTSQILLRDHDCPSGSYVEAARDGATVLATCGSESGGIDLLRMRPLESVLRPPVVLMSAPDIHLGFLTSPDGSRVVLVRQISAAPDPDSPGEFELMELDTADGAVTRRLRLPGVNSAFGLYWAGGDGEILVEVVLPGADPNARLAVLSVSLARQEVVRLSVGREWPFSGTPLVSGDGRYVPFASQVSNDIVTYDRQQPGQLLTLWSSASRGIAKPLSFIPGTNRLLVRTVGVGLTVEFWSVAVDSSAPPEIIASTVVPIWVDPYFDVLLAQDRLAFLVGMDTCCRAIVREVAIPGGADLGPLTPADGLYGFRQIRYFSANNSLLAVYWRPDMAGQLLTLFPRAAPETPQYVAADHEYKYIFGVSVDSAATTIGFWASVTTGSEAPRAFLVDANEPALSRELELARLQLSKIDNIQVLGTPL